MIYISYLLFFYSLEVLFQNIEESKNIVIIASKLIICDYPICYSAA